MRRSADTKVRGRFSELRRGTWSHTSLRTKRISVSKKFRALPPTDFFNNIGTNRTNRADLATSGLGGGPEVAFRGRQDSS
jgi:hypothetical protein